MSYILEALKRAEKERKLGQTPAALDEIAVPQAGIEQVRRRWLLIGAGAVLLIAAAVYAAVALFHGMPSTSAQDAAAAPASVASDAVEIPAPALPAAETAKPAVDARIEGGDTIASLDDLTGDSPASADMEAETANGSAAPAAAGPVPQSPPVKPALTKPSLTQPDSRALSPAPLQRKAEAPASPAPRGPRSPPSGPIVVLGDQAQAAEAASLNREPPAEEAARLPAAEPSAPPVPAQTASPAASEAATEKPAPAASAHGKAVRPGRTPPVETAAPARDRADRLDSLRRFKEMPPAYRAEFPPLTIDVHVYNADANRSFVIIGGKRYRAGDTLAEGPRIADIVSEGIVFEWRNEKVLYALGR
ncbi:MAG: hypothetical protein NVS9B10_17370 [Nevskia sp.]